MEQNSQFEDLNQIEVLEAQIRENFGNVVWSHKIQEKSADMILNIHNWIKISLILLSAITTTSLLLAILGDSRAGTIVGAIFSTILFGLTTYSKDYDLGEIAQKHINAANRLWNIRETYS